MFLVALLRYNYCFVSVITDTTKKKLWAPTVYTFQEVILQGAFLEYFQGQGAANLLESLQASDT